MVLIILISLIFAITEAIPFSHEVDFQHPESGERVKLKSTGQLTNAVDLDRIQGIKRVICESSKVLIAAHTNAIAKEWKEGQVILGSSKWDCFRNTLGSSSKGIYAKIKAIYFPTETGIVVHTENAGAFDVIDEADIKFHYHPGSEGSHLPEVRQRHRRYLANVLSELLHNIDWKANFSTTVPWNYDIDTQSIGPSFRIFTADTDNEYQMLFGTQNATNTETFSFACQSCHGISTFSYTFEMVIKKNALNQPNIIHYLSKLVANTTMNLDTSLSSSEAMRVEIYKTIMNTNPEVLFSIPVAVVEDSRIPPVTLTVNYNSQTHVNINMTASDAVHTSHKYNLSGSYEIVQEFSDGTGMQGYVKADNWIVRSENASTQTTKNFKLSTSVFQKINVTTTIGWFARDMEINFSPPVEFEIVPTMESTSSTIDVRRCTVDILNIEGNFNVSDARLIVDAFNVPIWNTLLAEGFNKTVNITKQEIFRSCRADCFQNKPNYEGIAPEEIVGTMKAKISRNDTSFYKLNQMVGNNVLFASEEADTATWCGYPGRTCVRCTDQIAGRSDLLKCADRMMMSKLASSISQLGKYVTAEWPERKLFVHEAWDEPTSINPYGEHGNTSLHYEGRAAVLSVSSILNNKTRSLIENDSAFSDRLQSLAVCAGFPYVSETNMHLVQVAVKSAEVFHMKRTQSRHADSKDIEAFKESLERLESVVTVERCPNINMSRHQHWPQHYKNEIEACGDTLYRIRRENENEMRSLYEYSDTDVEFENEGPLDAMCGFGRMCKECSKPSMSEATWDWCSTRTMSPRMALRLKRLAVLAKQDVRLKGSRILVTNAFDDKDDTGFSPLFKTGRGLRLNISTGEMFRLAELSVCAGFDYVQLKSNGLSIDYLEVFVKEQSGFRTTLNSFPSGELMISVAPPLDNPDDYSYPENLEQESRKPALIRPLEDGTKLSKHFTAGDFKDKSTFYMRIDTTLIECLDMVKESFGRPIAIIKAYTPKSRNKEKISEWNQDQLDRFQMGQAVVIQDEEQEIKSSIELAKLLMSSCSPSLRLQKRGLDLSIKDGDVCRQGSKFREAKYCIYVGIYPLDRTPNRQYIKLNIGMRVNTKDDNNRWEDLKEYRSELITGGPQIIPHDIEKACKPPELGDGNGYFSFKLNHVGFCLSFGNQKQCQQSTGARYNETEKLLTRLKATVSKSTLPVTEIQEAISKCLSDVCGGCPGAGPKWDKKVKACVQLITLYISYTKPLVTKNDRVAFFNTENEQSTAHGLACKGGSTCVENVQLYSILHTTVTAKYKPTVNSSIEEFVFDGHDNPSPLLQIVEQIIAKQASGNVTVYIENIRDISALRDILKILMIYNRGVKSVIFRILNGVNKEKLAAAIQRKIETWAGTACPRWSRYAVAPYQVEMVTPSRQARSIEIGIHRNKMKQKQRNWEIDWIMKT